jgi:hypothetical protein
MGPKEGKGTWFKPMEVEKMTLIRGTLVYHHRWEME